MQKTILITGATDGIGLVTAKNLVSMGHNVLIHGRNEQKLVRVSEQLKVLANGGAIVSYLADFSNLTDVQALAKQIKAEHSHLDVLINNAGIFKVAESITKDGLDVRFVVNTIAPFLLTQALQAILTSKSRVINLSSAAQAPVNIAALLGKKRLSDMEAYAQSKLAITMWTKNLADKALDDAPVYVSVNPGSLLASKMVKEGFGVEGADLSIGAKVLTNMALEADLANRSGQYFDNDSGIFANPHPSGMDVIKSSMLVETLEKLLLELV